MSYLTIRNIALFTIFISVFSLAGAFFAQYVMGLAPCQLCIWQRWPFVGTIILGLIALLMSEQKALSALAIALAGLIFLANSAIAFFHTGVERLWWEGLKGCSAPDMSGTVEELMARIQNSNGARCDEIPWADPILGLSMANYNVLLCLGMGLICLVAAFRAYKKH